MTREQFLSHLAALSPAQRRVVLAMARTIRTAREAGDQRPAAEIVAHLVQPSRRTGLH